MRRPHRVAFTDHAVDRADRYGVTQAEASDVVLEGHPRRVRNPGDADWQIRRGRLVVVYDWPDAGDDATARIVSLWLRG